MTIRRQDVTQRLAEYVSGLRYDDLPVEVIQQAKMVILDALGCQVACSMLENGRLIIQFGQSLGGQAEASVLGGNYRTSAINAALINGTLGHGDEIDESLEEAGHASAVIVPAALACGEKERASGKDMIAAVVAGYDIAGRLANAGLSMRAGFSSNASEFWGVATACNILKLKASETRIAFGLAALHSGGFFDLSSEARHMAKSLTKGLSSRNGVTVALLAKMGYDGPKSVFDGTNNILSKNVGENYDQGELIKDLGKKYLVMTTCLKLYSAGHPIHAPAYGLLKIMEREGISAEDIKAITARQPEEEKRIVDNRDMPEITIQYCLAVAAFDRQLTWDQYTPERVKDPKVLNLKSRVTSVHDPKLDERKKTTKAHSAEVDVETKDGRKFTERVDYPPGDPGNPASQEDIDKKVMYYASKVLGQKRTRSLIEAVKKLESVTDLNQLGDLLRI
ncbi:MAG: 2-methylcitrate dehydratase [Dehalococcoidales bacterium]|nr:2-methylcitrate dehydratase [Dehalococcoidales bacterium]